MELATVILFFFVTCIVLMILSVPLLIISRVSRMIKISYAKLFNKPRPTKA